jgi:hypothetical protein
VVSDVDFAQIFIRMASLPMSYVENKVGKRVRLLPDFYITRLRPVARWEGVIIGTTEVLQRHSHDGSNDCLEYRRLRIPEPS